MDILSDQLKQISDQAGSPDKKTSLQAQKIIDILPTGLKLEVYQNLLEQISAPPTPRTNNTIIT